MILIVRGLDQEVKRKIGIKEKSSKDVHYLVLRVQPRQSGGDSKEVPPVPIPNTEVKLFHVDNTWWATAREDR